jgi:hypothetical protein
MSESTDKRAASSASDGSASSTYSDAEAEIAFPFPTTHSMTHRRDELVLFLEQVIDFTRSQILLCALQNRSTLLVPITFCIQGAQE